MSPANPSTDLNALRRLMTVPEAVTQAEWQSGRFAPHGSDWWLAAVLDLPEDQASALLQGPSAATLVESPPGLALTSAFAALTQLPGAQRVGGQRIRVVTDSFAVLPFARAPLRNGQAIRLSPTRVLVVLWTM